MLRCLFMSCAFPVAAAALVPVGLAAQRRVTPAERPKTPMQVSLQVGADPFSSSAPGTCEHADLASIYNVRAELWRVESTDGNRSLSMTLWRPKDGSADMVTLAYSSGSTSQQVSTIRGAAGTSGSAKVAFEAAGKGGTFKIDAKAGNGTPISGTVKCEAFTPAMAEGG